MSARKIDPTKTFLSNLKDLSKKHPDLSDAVDEALDGYAETGESSASSKIPRMKGLPVFKERLAFGNQGKRGAARIIYYCDSELVVPMFLYTKNVQAVREKKILDALKSADLI